MLKEYKLSRFYNCLFSENVLIKSLISLKGSIGNVFSVSKHYRSPSSVWDSKKKNDVSPTTDLLSWCWRISNKSGRPACLIILKQNQNGSRITLFAWAQLQFAFIPGKCQFCQKKYFSWFIVNSITGKFRFKHPK